MARARLVVVAVGLLLACGQAWGSSIALFSTPDYSSNCLELPAEAPSGTIYIVASGPFTEIFGGLAAAEFGVDGLPTNWVAISTPSPLANISVGDPFADGANIAFPTPQLADRVLLYTVTVIRVPPIIEAVLQVRAHTHPTSPYFNCPRIVGGDAPVDPNSACVEGGTLLVAGPGQCTVGVTQQTWTRVKALYD